MSSSETGAYAGDLSPEDALALLESRPDSVLVDVRTRAEWNFVGTPDLSSIGKQTLLLEWQTYPSMQQDPAFVQHLEGELAARGVSPDAPLMFLCRSGARSRAAAIAITALGSGRDCFNIANGFEGPPDEAGHRGTLAGWKAAGLPWTQP
jgi:rhodanese-related sulfurtransferase